MDWRQFYLLGAHRVHCRRWAIEWLAVAAFGAAAVVGVWAVDPQGFAYAQGAAEFLDQRPIEVDLGDVPQGRRWQVTVVNGTAVPADLTLRVVFDDPGVFGVGGPDTLQVGPGGLASFVLTLDRLGPGSGQLVVLGPGGVLARRELRAVSRASAPITELNLTAWRLSPFLGDVRVPTLSFIGPTENRELGRLASASGGLATVRQDGDKVRVEGLETTGEYTGTAVLTPGTATKVRVRVRDTAGWPLLLLLGGLLLMGKLDLFQKRSKPRRELQIRLTQLARKAQTRQHEAQKRVREDLPWEFTGIDQVTTDAAEPRGELVIDVRCSAALAAWDQALDQKELDGWGPGGPELQKIGALVDLSGELHDRWVSLAGEYRRLLQEVERGGRRQDLEALKTGALAEEIREVLTPRAITDEGTLQARLAAVRRGVEWITQFKRTYRTLISTCAIAPSGPLREEAAQALATLLNTRGELTAAEANAYRLRSMVGETSGPGSPSTLSESPPTTTSDPSYGAPQVRTRKPRTLALASAVLAVILGVLVATTLILQSSDLTPTSAPPGTALPSLLPSPRPTIPPLPDAPVAKSTDPATREGASVQRLDSGGWFEFTVAGFLAPAMIGLVGAAGVKGATRAFRRRSRRQQSGQVEIQVQDPGLDQLLALHHRAERRFAFANGVLVSLTGLSVLYFPNPTFGSTGDYLAVFLWGSAVSEGVQLARSLFPGLRPR